MPGAVTDYRVEVLAEKGWRQVVNVEDNRQRQRVHAFGPGRASATGLTVLKVWDPRYRARVCEVRIY